MAAKEKYQSLLIITYYYRKHLLDTQLKDAKY